MFRPTTAPADRIRTARTASGFVVASRPVEARAAYVKAWHELGRRSLVENLFYEPGFTLAGINAFGAEINLLMVGDRPPEETGLRLLAVWPFRVGYRWGVPLPTLIGWSHGTSIFGAPLIDQDDPTRALAALLEAPGYLRLPCRFLMPYLPLEGSFADAFADVARTTIVRHTDFWSHERAHLELSGLSCESRSAYVESRLSRRKSAQLDRQWRRLERDHAAFFETVDEPHGLLDALADYAAVEARGWKGRKGTSLSQRSDEFDLLRRLVADYGAAKRMRIDRLRRGERSLAVSIGFYTASTFWYLKIAYAEDEAKNSPGAHLVRSVTRSLLADPLLLSGDSCAPPNFQMIETFWTERRRLAHRLLGIGSGDPLYSVAVRLETLRAVLATARNRFIR